MISVKGVTKRFGRVVALADVSLTVRPGERVAVVGSNGSGKTTLLRALCGLLRHEGQVEVAGVDVARAPEVALRSLAYVPQVAPPLDAPVAELVRAACALRGLAVADVAACAGTLGLSLEAVARTRVRDLSGGMKQKLLAALALAARTPVLVCDEPTANLDPAARAAFFDAVNARPADAVLVLCSHRVDEVRHLVDRVVELEAGRVLRDGPLSDVMARLQGCRVELTFTQAPAGTEAAGLTARGLAPLSPTRWAGTFPHAQKVEVVGRLVAAYGERLADLSVLDSEGLHEAGPDGTLRRVG